MMNNVRRPSRTCPFCGATAVYNAKFCRGCGRSIREIDASEASVNSKPDQPIRSHTKVVMFCAVLAFLTGVLIIGASLIFAPSPRTSNVSGELAGAIPANPPTPPRAVSTQDRAPNGSSNPPTVLPFTVGNAASVAKQSTALPNEVVVSPTGLKSEGTGKRNDSAFVICLDPGHPSEVGRGTQGKHITEIQVAWRVALKLQTLLKREGMTVVMTKQDENQFVRNEERANIANRAHAALMVRLHCDADAGSGFATYAPTQQGKNNGKIGPALSVISNSKRMARQFHIAMSQTLEGSLMDRGLHSDTATQVGGKQGALTGSIYSQVPVLLVEMCVLTNQRDEAFIDNDEGQQRMAQAMADGVSAALQSRGNQ